MAQIILQTNKMKVIVTSLNITSGVVHFTNLYQTAVPHIHHVWQELEFCVEVWEPCQKSLAAAERH